MTSKLTAADHRRAWSLAWPMILGGVSGPLLGMVDTAVMGHLDTPPFLGAVALGAMIFQFLFWGLGFLRMSTTGLTAHALGGGSGQVLHDVLTRAVLMALILSALLLLLQRPVSWLAFKWITSAPEMIRQAQMYYDIRIWAAPATLINYVILGWFLGLQRPRIPLLLMLLMNALNIILDLYFVVGLGMKTEGVAWASVITEYCGLAAGLWFVRVELGRHEGRLIIGHILRPDLLRQTLVLNQDIFIRTIVLISAFALFTLQGARMGASILAANAVLMNFMHFMAYGLDGFAHTAEALVGESLGRRDVSALKRSLKVTVIWSAIIAVLFAMVYAVAGELIIRELTDIGPLRSLAREYLPWLVIMPLVGVWAYWLDGVFIGAMQSRWLRNAMLAAFGLIYLPALWLLQSLGNHGLWLSLFLFMLARALFLAPGLGRLGRVAAQAH
jgi:multidrug resistance protein, MATE family